MKKWLTLSLLVLGMLPAFAQAQSYSSVRERIAVGDAAMGALNYQDAVDAYEGAVAIEPKNADAQFRLGNAASLVGDTARATTAWERAEQLTQDPGLKALIRSRLDGLAPKPAAAEVAPPPAAAPPPPVAPVPPAAPAAPVPPAAPTPPPAPTSGTVTAVAEVQKDVQKPVLSDAARADYEAGVAAINNRQFPEALRKLNLALRSAPTFASGYVARGSALIGLRRYAEALTDYQYALKLEPSRITPYYGIGEANRALGKKDEAREAYKRIVDSNSNEVHPTVRADAEKKLKALE